ncbi:MAG: protein kinase domain-containing protein [Akkermansiaceae bacterium]
MENIEDRHIDHCSSCGCKMDISSMEPFTNIMCPECGQHTRVKCKLGNYELVSRHAVGGMSKLFIARDLTLDREVAIKILNDEYCRDSQRMRQFEHEALITAAISHPHVVRVFTVGRAFGHFYIAMELVLGESLEQRMGRSVAMSESDILPLCAEIISGLQSAQEAGLIHRDIKPGNILLDSNGHAKIVDFGLALVTHGGVAKAEEVWATPYYVPPEALRGEQEDFRSDMYALGATLYHALSGRPPIPEQSKSTHAVLSSKAHIAPLEKIAPWLKPETCQLVEKAMSFNRDARFQSYKEMEEARALANHAIEEFGADDPEYVSEDMCPEQRGKIMMATIWVCALSVLVLILSLWVFKSNSGNEDKSEGPAELIDVRDAMLGNDASYTPELAEEIGKLFHLSHQHLAEGRYMEAKRIFEKLMRDERVAEPASSWGGVEAIIAAWLDGETRQAELAAKALLEHIEKQGESADSSVAMLAEHLADPAVSDHYRKRNDEITILELMALALKNWELGAWEHAMPNFEKATNWELPGESPLKVYHDLAGKYLTDYANLQMLEALPESADKKQVDQHLEVLKKTKSSLQTKGRAEFYVNVWQSRAHRHLQSLERAAREAALAKAQEQARAQKEKTPSYREQLVLFHKLVSRSKFSDAHQALQLSSAEPSERAQLDAWLYLAKSAQSFLVDLEKAVAREALQIEVLALNGASYHVILTATGEGLKLRDDTGEVFLAWGDIEPESILGIYREIFDLNIETLDGQRLTEHAICYALLMKMTDKAQRAAAELVEVNDNFNKRWQNTVTALDLVDSLPQ